MRARATLAVVAVLVEPGFAMAQGVAPQVLEGYAVADEREAPVRREPGFFRWGYSIELGAAIPVGDRSCSTDGCDEFVPAFDLGFDVGFDVGRHVQLGLLGRVGFGGVDADCSRQAIVDVLGYQPDAVRATLIQAGARLRVYLLERSHVRPFLAFECAFTSMGLTARADLSCPDGSCETERTTVLSSRYRAASLAPGLGVRYDVGLRARPGLPRFSRVLAVSIQATYGVNLWQDVKSEVLGRGEGRSAIEGLRLDHVRISASAGVMF
jgi:hypothetical protein